MSEMVERVARAICRASACEPDANAGWLLDRDRKLWQNYEGLARAAIEAMREPTDGMAAIGEGAALKYGAMYAWHLMIDEALDRNGLIKGDVPFRGIDEALK